MILSCESATLFVSAMIAAVGISLIAIFASRGGSDTSTAKGRTQIPEVSNL